ncbi:MAG TPA: ATP-binding cassette domain-containing protein, partial [Aliarcobacter sp.]|nr:ATP-binding cassette domain-containing protein [Aliarcobacter sp.]
MIKELKGAILIISGPSGCGKSTLLKEICKNIPNYYFSISTTTRELRGEEEDGVDYHFVSQE